MPWPPLPGARTISVPEAPEASPAFAETLRDFCQELWAADEADSAPSQRDPERS
jgi:hypothetical protein